jgi:hypothetical protein
VTRNITLRLDEAILRQARVKAVQEDQSLSEWVANLVAEAVAGGGKFAAAKRRALRRLEKAVDLDGKPLTREEAHER